MSELHQHMRDSAGSGVQGLMLGRWLLRRPLDLLAIDRQLEWFNNNNNSNNHNNNSDDSSTNANTISPLLSEYSDVLVEAIQQYAIYAQVHAEQKIYPLSQIMLPLILISEQLQGFTLNFTHLLISAHHKL